MAGKGAIREAADRFSEKVASFYEEMLDAEKTARAKCKCGRNFDVPVPDWNARAKAIETLLSHGYGKPGTQRDEGADLAAAAAKEVEELSAEERKLLIAELRKRVAAK